MVLEHLRRRVLQRARWFVQRATLLPSVRHWKEAGSIPHQVGSHTLNAFHQSRQVLRRPRQGVHLDRLTARMAQALTSRGATRTHARPRLRLFHPQPRCVRVLQELQGLARPILTSCCRDSMSAWQRT